MLPETFHGGLLQEVASIQLYCAWGGRPYFIKIESREKLDQGFTDWFIPLCLEKAVHFI